jgi:ABC-type arginine transport system ATPase subunit
MDQPVVIIKKHYNLAVIPDLKELQESSSTFQSLEEFEIEPRRRVTAHLVHCWNSKVIEMGRMLEISEVNLHWFTSDDREHVLYGFTTN